MNRLNRIPLLLLLVSLACAPFYAAWAGDDHMEARRLRESGDILPLQTILDRLHDDYPGKVLEVELEHKHHRVYYEVEILDDRGVVHEIFVDARSGKIIRAKEED
jgi:uncharacterized membrane protein YkoI